MRKRFALLTIGTLSVLGALAPSASAAGQFCYDLKVNANGSEVVNQAGCQDLPL